MVELSAGQMELLDTYEEIYDRTWVKVHFSSLELSDTRVYEPQIRARPAPFWAPSQAGSAQEELSSPFSSGAVGLTGVPRLQENAPP